MKTTYALEKSINEARNFIDAANSALEAFEKNQFGGKENATAKRRSMDLTHALVELRKSTVYE